MKNFLKDLAAICTLPVLYLFVISLLSETFSRVGWMNVLDDSVLFSGGIFIAFSVMCSVIGSMIKEDT